MRFRFAPVLFVAVAVFSLPPLAHAAIPFFGPILPANIQTCPASWGGFMEVINNLISFGITLAIVGVAPLMIAYSGFLMVIEPASPGGRNKAKTILTNTIVGIVIALASWLIVDAIMAVLYNPSSFGSTWSELITSGNMGPCLSVATSFNQTPSVTNGGSGLMTAPSGSTASAPAGSCVAASQAAAAQYGSTPNCNPAQDVQNRGTNYAGLANSINQNYGNIISQCSSEQGIPSSVLVGISAAECSGAASCNDPAANGCAKGGYGATGVSCSEVRSYCGTSNSAACSGVSSMPDSQLISAIQSNQSLSFCATAYAMRNNYSQYGSWGSAAVAYNGGAGALAPSQSCPGYLVMQCPIANTNSQFPYCTTTCGYQDIFTNYMTAAGGTGMGSFETRFTEYMAAADAAKSL